MIRELNKTGMDYEFVEGVEGRDLDLRDTSLFDPTWQGRSPFWPGVAGCALSHLKVYKKVLEDGVERALVLEDDVILPADVGALVEAVATRMTGAEAVMLQYFSCNSAARGEPCRMNRRGSVRLSSSRVLALPVDVSDLGGAGAYLVTRDSCQRMARAVLPVRVAADDWAFFYNNGALEKVSCVVPMPVRLNLGFRTTIDHYEPGSLQTHLRKAAVRVPFLRQALTFRRQRIMARMTQVEPVDDPLS